MGKSEKGRRTYSTTSSSVQENDSCYRIRSVHEITHYLTRHGPYNEKLYYLGQRETHVCGVKKSQEHSLGAPFDLEHSRERKESTGELLEMRKHGKCVMIPYYHENI